MRPMVKPTEEQKAIPEDQIDLSIIPEMTDGEWPKDKGGMFYEPTRK